QEPAQAWQSHLRPRLRTEHHRRHRTHRNRNGQRPGLTRPREERPLPRPTPRRRHPHLQAHHCHPRSPRPMRSPLPPHLRPNVRTHGTRRSKTHRATRTRRRPHIERTHEPLRRRDLRSWTFTRAIRSLAIITPMPEIARMLYETITLATIEEYLSTHR